MSYTLVYQAACFSVRSISIDTPPFLGSLGNNQLCGLDERGRGTYTAEGITKLCDGLKGSGVTLLERAAAPSVRLLSAPRDTPQPPPLLPHARSLSGNRLGPEGGAALAEGLKGNSTLQLL